MSSAEKIQPLRREEKDYTNEVQHDLIESSRKDMGRIGLFIAVLCVVLLVVFFFGFSQNFSSMSTRIESLEGVQDQVGRLDQRVNGLETSMAALEDLPEKARNMVLRAQVQEMAQMAAYLSSQMGDEAQSEQLKQAQAILDQVRKNMAAQ
jgi:hypothetical protein